jgi:hypothetical protein
LQGAPLVVSDVIAGAAGVTAVPEPVCGHRDGRFALAASRARDESSSPPSSCDPDNM